MLKWIGLPGVFGLVLFLPHLELMAFIVMGAAGAIFVVLLDLPVIEARQDRVLNEIALQKEREKERGF